MIIGLANTRGTPAMFAAIIAGLVFEAGLAAMADASPPPLSNATAQAPEGFPRFMFSGHDQEARVLSDFLWHHFIKRLGNGKTLFNKEYLTTADMWLAGALERKESRRIQEVHRANILEMQLDDEGYVHTHQHFSHAHDHGWPFPLWPQAGYNAETCLGVTVGWHFQHDGPSSMWIWNFLKGWKLTDFYGDAATKKWKLEDCRSEGIVDGAWRIVATGRSPAIITPAEVEIDAFNAPFLALRYDRTGESPTHATPYIEWLREGETEFGADRRVYLHPERTKHDHMREMFFTTIPMHKHPRWKGKIKRIRISLAPGESDVRFDIDSFFTAYDTRHPINNPIFVFASWNYFRWTGDLDFLRANLNRMRIALLYLMTEMGGMEHNLILNTWPGHDGLPGWEKDADGKLTMHPGHGIGNNYYDLVPFGWKDCYSTMQYYAALRVMAELEQAVRDNPGWDVPRGALALDPQELREHAARVKEVGNRVFWSDRTGRYIACVDKEGQRRDYGFTWLGLEAVWYGFATDDHARQIMAWIDGKRIVEGDTSTGEDIYRWRFGPRVTTLRNIEWYGQGWNVPESIPWGGQIQDGGAVLGFTFYDLLARLNVLGPDDAWRRLTVIIEWEKEVQSEGGYRAYYADGKRGTTLQGGGTAGGIGVDCEFFESSLVPSIVVYGFLGLDPGAETLRITPRLPSQCPEMGVSNLLYRNTIMDVRAAADTITLTLKTEPIGEFTVELTGCWKSEQTGESGSRFNLSLPKTYTFRRTTK